MQTTYVSLPVFLSLAKRSDIRFPYHAKVAVYVPATRDVVLEFRVSEGRFLALGEERVQKGKKTVTRPKWMELKEKKTVLSPTGAEITIAHSAPWRVAGPILAAMAVEAANALPPLIPSPLAAEQVGV
jgi:hypothetical protein